MKKITKILITILLIFNFIYINIPSVYASMVAAAIEESGEAPEPFTPPDGDGSLITDNEIKITTIPYNNYNYIQGNVYEDLGERYFITNGNENSRKRDSKKQTIPIESIIVRCHKDGTDENKDKYVKTDANGFWRFKLENDSDVGSYSIEYYYGQLGNNKVDIDFSNSDEVKNILRYNGLDYLVSKISGNYTYIENKKTINDDYSADRYETEQSSEGVTQVILTIDCSYSMRNDKKIINDEEKTNLEIAVSSAKRMISDLLNRKSNIYIGLVFFSGKNYRAVSLTKNKNELYLALDDILENNWYTANTNVVSAIDKAVNSFYTDENRYIVLISDGFPTAATATNGRIIQTYYNDDTETIYQKIDIIRQITKNKIKEVLDKEINLISLFTLSNDEDDRDIVDLVKNIYFDGFEDYKNNTCKVITDEDQNFGDIINDDIERKIQEESENNIKETTVYKPAIGYEDYERYKEIVEKFKIYNYKIVKQLDLIDNYNGDEETDKVEAKDLSTKIYGHVYGGKYVIPRKYKISDLPREQVKYDDNGNIIEIIKYVIVNTGYNENMYLAKRPAFSLSLNIENTGVEIKLSNGTEYVNKTKKAGSQDVLVTTVQEDLVYGSEVLLTYTGQIKNESKMPYSSLEVICYLPNYVSISENMSDEYQIRAESIENLYLSGMIGEEPYMEYKDTKQAVIVKFNFNSDTIKNTINMCEFKIKASIRINTLEDLEGITCIGEIYSYSNYTEYTNQENSSNKIITSRRMTVRKYGSSDNFIEKEVGITPSNNTWISAEIDWSESDEAPIIGPTGLSKENVIKNRMIKITLLILIVLIILISTILIINNKKRK